MKLHYRSLAGRPKGKTLLYTTTLLTLVFQLGPANHPTISVWPFAIKRFGCTQSAQSEISWLRSPIEHRVQHSNGARLKRSKYLDRWKVIKPGS